MTALATVRTELADLLAGATGYKGFAYIPEALRSRIVAVTPPESGDYLAPGTTFGSLLVRLDAHLIIAPADNKSIATELDEVFEEAVVAVVNGGWSLESISTSIADPDGDNYLAASITVSRDIRL